MRRFLATLGLIGLTACGEAVTDPLREGFAVDPAPVLGDWAVRLDLPDQTFSAVVQRDVGTLSGFFEYELWGRWWIVHFRDASWDGSAFSWIDGTDFGQNSADSLVYWTASYSPPRLTLTASFGPARGCCVVVMHYLRP